MMIARTPDDDELQLNAYCDGELDAASAIDLDRRMAEDEALRVRYIRLLSLRRAIRSLPQSDLPPGLQARIQSKLDADRRDQSLLARRAGRARRGWSFQALAAAAVFGAVIASSVILTIERYDVREDVARQVLSGHIRGLLAPQPFDVASSDGQAVRPWFTSRLPESPQVPDLAAEGFVLVGGRVDIVDHHPVATIVYRYATHIVSVTTLPPGQSVSDQAIAGYNLRSWSDANFSYVVVSDLPSEDLAICARAFAEASPETKID